MRPLNVSIGIAIGLTFSTLVAAAWTGPTASPPIDNAAAPINVGTNDQVKNGGLGVNALAVFGDALIEANGHLNFGTTSGDTGYGFRDEAGTMEYKNSGGNWSAFGEGGGVASSYDISMSSYGTYWKTITVPSASIVQAACYVEGTDDDENNDNAGVLALIEVNGNTCGESISFNYPTSNASFAANPSCIYPISAGENTVTCVTEAYGTPQDVSFVSGYFGFSATAQ